jgi:putative transposase
LEKSQCDLNKSQFELNSSQNKLDKNQSDLDKNQLERDSIQNELKKSQCDLDKNQLERDSIQNGLEKSQCDLDKKQLELELSIKLNKARESQLQDNERKLKEDRLVLEAKKIKLKQKHAQLQKKHDREKGRGELEENQLDLAEHALKEEEHINEFADTHFKREAIKHWLKNKHNDCENKLKQIEKPFKSTENQVDLEKISIELEAELNALEEKWYQSAIDWLNLEDTRNHLEKKQLELKAKLGKLKKNRIQLENKRNLAECRSDSEKKHDDIAKYKLKADKNLIEFADTHFKLEAIRHRLKNNHSDSENQLEQVEKPFEFTENQIDLEKSSIENEAALNALAKKWGQFAMRLLDLKARDELETKQIALKEEQLKLEDKSRFSAIDLCAKTTEWRNDPKTAWLSKAPAHVLQQSVMDLDKGFTNYYAGRAGFPRFKKKGQSESFRYPDPKQIKFDQKNSRIFLPKIGWVGYHNSREVQGEIKYVTVSKDAGEWYISITTLHKVKNISLAEQDVSGIAIDVGVVLLAALSDGTVYPSLEKLKKLEVQLNRAQRALSRKEEGSENWKKNCAEIQRIYATARNVRRDYLHKITTTIAKNHGVVCIEDLNVQNMSKSAAGTLEEPGKNVKAKSGLNRAILRQGWGEFFRMLEYKLERRGGLLIAVPPQYTSQTCPCCGHVSADNRKTQAKFHCVSCGFEENADVVGAINVHIKGINVLVEQRDVLRNQLQILQSNAPADCLETINSINKISDCVLQLNSGINALVDSLKIKKRRAGSASQSVESGSRSVKQKPTEALSAAGTLDF